MYYNFGLKSFLLKSHIQTENDHHIDMRTSGWMALHCIRGFLQGCCRQQRTTTFSHISCSFPSKRFSTGSIIIRRHAYERHKKKVESSPHSYTRTCNLNMKGMAWPHWAFCLTFFFCLQTKHIILDSHIWEVCWKVLHREYCQCCNHWNWRVNPLQTCNRTTFFF